MKGWEEKHPGEVEVDDVVVFSQFWGEHHNGMLRAIDGMLPVMITVNGKVTKAEDREIDTGGGYNVRRFLRVSILSDVIMHGAGITEQYKYESHDMVGLPEFEFMFHADETVAVVLDDSSDMLEPKRAD